MLGPPTSDDLLRLKKPFVAELGKHIASVYGRP
jgi:hypothetical protein